MDTQPYAGATAVILYRRLAQDPGAATEFLRGAVDEPQMLFESALDQTALDELLAVAVGPTHVDAGTAGEIVVPLVRWMIDEGRYEPTVLLGDGPCAQALAATLVAPWLMHFGARADQWGWDAEEGDALLRDVIGDPDGFDRLVTGLQEWSGGLTAVPLMRDGLMERTTVQEIAHTFWQLAHAFRDEEITDGDADRMFVDLAIWVAENVVGQIPSRAVALTGELLVPLAVDGLEELGLMPPDHDTVRDDAHLLMEKRMAAAAVVVTTVLVRQLTDDGVLAEDTIAKLDIASIGGGCVALAVHERITTFIDGIDDREIQNILQGALDAVLAGTYASELCDME